MAAQEGGGTKSIAIMILTAILAVFAGMAVAAASLALRYVPEVSSRTQNLEPGQVYYVKGDTAETPGWTARAASLAAGTPGSYAFSEGDLNAWSRANLRATPPARQDAGQPFFVVRESPNFRVLEDGRLQVTLRVGLRDLMPGRAFTYQSIGSAADGRFHSRSGWLGQSPVPLVNGLLFNMISKSLSPTDSARLLGNQVAECSVEAADGQVVVQHP